MMFVNKEKEEIKSKHVRVALETYRPTHSMTPLSDTHKMGLMMGTYRSKIKRVNDWVVIQSRVGRCVVDSNQLWVSRATGS